MAWKEPPTTKSDENVLLIEGVVSSVDNGLNVASHSPPGSPGFRWRVIVPGRPRDCRPAVSLTMEHALMVTRSAGTWNWVFCARHDFAGIFPSEIRWDSLLAKRRIKSGHYNVASSSVAYRIWLSEFSRSFLSMVILRNNFGNYDDDVNGIGSLSILIQVVGPFNQQTEIKFLSRGWKCCNLGAITITDGKIINLKIKWVLAQMVPMVII